MSSKRSLSPINVGDIDVKRQKFGQGVLRDEAEPTEVYALEDDYRLQEQQLHAGQSTSLTRHYFVRRGIQRSIAMVLSHDGFESASPEALESFTEMVETYLKSIIEEIKRLAISSRRDHPIPSDFEAIMKRYNLTLSALKPHLKNPAPRNDIAPVYVDSSPTDNDAFSTLPLLGEELSGQQDKDSKHYIPSSFPDFPSTHTYKCTPQEDARVRDSKKIREEAARTAQQGEDALRRLVRASKMRKQKEVKSLVERDSQGKERFRLWESTMRRFMGGDNRGDHADQVEIADHSMIVNGDVIFSRQEVSRLGKRTGPLSGHPT
ncbi:Transcription initiation factor TFIID subunit 8 [Cladobotryum mycophilum]|uniref:Transcription initiation factor TFIID subunit 8 n=1 Tax=Cladobotryum mycophilum TaxID=491253 RepID=A0ABR0SGZ8_9HYPO